jgi:hypothetical protein
MLMRKLTRRTIYFMALALAPLGLLLAMQPLSPGAQATPAAPVFTVNSTGDAHAALPLNDGICRTDINNNVCTLRAAIEKANHYPGGGVTINVPAIAPGKYLLTLGALPVSNTMTITGGGLSGTIVDGNGSLTNDSVFRITRGAVLISGLSIQGGKASNSGGGIQASPEGGPITLTLNTVWIHNNSVVYFGAGVFVAGPFASLVVNNSRISDNLATGAGGFSEGGGLFCNLCDLRLNLSSIANNQARGAVGVAGGVYNSGQITVTYSTILSNTATGDGGGLYNYLGTALLVNSTLSGNRADKDGGGVHVAGGSVSLYNGTVAFNSAGAALSSVRSGGGVANYSGTLNLKNSLIAQNRGTSYFNGIYFGVAADCAGPLSSLGYNFVGTGSGPACSISGPTPLTGDAQLGPLAYNGGPTPTHALLPGSPAIDAGEVPNCTDNLGVAIPNDQRQYRRPVYGASAYRCDIGAFEVQRLLFLPLTVR